MVDVTVTAANVQQGTKAVKHSANAGEAITAGAALYLDASVSPSVLKLAQADAAATAKVAGFALNDAATGQPVTYSDDDPDYNPGGTVVVAGVYVLSANAAGKIAPFADLVSTNILSILGGATTAAELPININNTGAVVP